MLIGDILYLSSWEWNAGEGAATATVRFEEIGCLYVQALLPIRRVASC
jgi:hypothetical protein